MCISGELAGGVVLVGLSLFGAGAILSASSELFQIVKWTGVFYMAQLGYRQIVEEHQVDVNLPMNAKKQNGMSSAREGFFTAVLSPKAVVFYVALLSQLLDPIADNYS